MKEFNDKSIGGRIENAQLSGYVFNKTIFDSCICTRSLKPGNWSSLKEMLLIDVSQVNCDIHTTKIEKVSLDNLKRLGSDPLFLWGCVFKNVKLTGKISGIKINRNVGLTSLVPSGEQALWDEAIKNYYTTVDWALDISQARFAGGISLEAIPGEKIIRNPETQVLVKRSSLFDKDWRSIDYGKSSFDIALSWFLSDSLFDSVVLVARMGSKDGKNDVEVLTRLRQAGIAE